MDSLSHEIARLRLALCIATTGCIAASTVALVVSLRTPRELDIGHVHIDEKGIRVHDDENSFLSLEAKKLSVGHYDAEGNEYQFLGMWADTMKFVDKRSPDRNMTIAVHDTRRTD